MMDYKKRWGIADEPNGERFIKKREITKPIIDSWDEFGDDEKEKLIGIKNILQREIDDCEVAIFGSRIKGYWTDSSDYDIMIIGDIDTLRQNEIRCIDFKYKIDFLFLKTEIKGNTKYIKIP